MAGRSPRGVGFTLVEIMVALGVFALLAVVAYGRIGTVVDQQRVLEQRTLATWVARNRIAAIELEHAEEGTLPPTGQREDRVTLGGRSWTVRSLLARSDHPGLVRLEVAVHDDAEDASAPPAITLVRELGPQ